ncbi:hypothetical protein F9288_05730 [Sphingomonas sp. CL5.1]|uniref:hypothetical protein n=1 Tax=Sphingomonas sp. CL5.1 TaxID=2653203 RepID=UPI001581BBD1|nr:hypothetical protein [Sphingomonas sp. CL5.1]QKR99207.1 hypothetical protein F9288_05730 [Sphingomonas sp. CL5.1]
MANKRSHVVQGIIFIAVCTGIGIAIFVIDQSGSARIGSQRDASTISTTLKSAVTNDTPANVQTPVPASSARDDVARAPDVTRNDANEVVDATTAQRPPPTPHFVDGSNYAVPREIVEAADRIPSFNRTYVQSAVSCGTGCTSIWFYDRKTGVVLGSPDESQDGESLDDVKSTADSDIVTVTYSPSDGVGDNCSARSYRLTGYKFRPVSPRRPVKCEH